MKKGKHRGTTDNKLHVILKLASNVVSFSIDKKNTKLFEYFSLTHRIQFDFYWEYVPCVARHRLGI